ncbi:MAG: hypothetical protein IJP04_02320 [Clostridia bacterium]|nr:hypothetical protein [Clostridia bacterium]
MKKYIIIVCLLVAAWLGWDAAHYRLGVYVDLTPHNYATTFSRADRDAIYLDRGNGFEAFEIRGIDLGAGEPGEWATDYGIEEETYLRWFQQMKEMGANTVRVYSIQSEPFYDAFYKYNLNNPDPLYMIHGLWINSYMQNSYRDAYADDFLDTFLNDCRTLVDVIHGNKKISLGEMASSGHGKYMCDISPWVIGYILGIEWEDSTVVYTDEKYFDNPRYNQYQGQYMYTTPEATPFEAMLAQVGDQIIEYETKRYKQQRLIAFSNWPTTDPFEYPLDIAVHLMKCACVDVEHIQSTESFLSGQFASYHVYPYHPDYLNYMDDWSALGIMDREAFRDANSNLNTYRAYLSLLAEHHSTMPVIISEFGVSTGRGMAQHDLNTNRNQGNMSESAQGQALIDCYEDIMASGCAGSCVFSWQDEWFKRTWNTMYAVDLNRTPYWSDYQTNEQYFGLLSFDPGKEASVCYVDGDLSEWTDADIISEADGMTLSMKYDEKFIYLMLEKEQLAFGSAPLYIAFDITPKSGTEYSADHHLNFDRGVDFVLTLDGENNSRLQVQERYEALRSTYAQETYQYDTYLLENIPAADSNHFSNIDMILLTATALLYHDQTAAAETFETGLLTYGNANPSSPDFNSLADFICSGDAIEIKLPWQLLNFADPSRMMIHDDYYDGNYGVEFIQIDEIFIGAGMADTIHLSSVPLTGWNNKVTYHERLKDSYYMMQDLWNPDF